MSVGEDLLIERIAGKDGLIKGSLKLTDGGGVKQSRSHEFHDYEELLLVFGEFLLHGRESFTTLMNIVWCQAMDLLNERIRGLFEEVVLFNCVNKIHFN